MIHVYSAGLKSLRIELLLKHEPLPPLRLPLLAEFQELERFELATHVGVGRPTDYAAQLGMITSLTQLIDTELCLKVNTAMEICKMTGLQSLSIDQASDGALEKLADLKCLTHFLVYDVDRGDSLSRLTNLVKLELLPDQIAEGVFEAVLPNLLQLKDLTINCTLASSFTVACLAGLTQLQFLMLCGVIFDEGIVDVLSTLPQLSKLSLLRVDERSKMDPIEINKLTNLESLSLSFGGDKMVNPLDFILDGALYRLKYFNMEVEEKEEEVGEELYRRLPSLRHFNSW